MASSPPAPCTPGALRKGRPGGHDTVRTAVASPRPETLKQVRRITSRGVTIDTFMLDASPELVSSVESMTRINKGRVLYTQPSRLGSNVMVDYQSRRRTLRR